MNAQIILDQGDFGDIGSTVILEIDTSYVGSVSPGQKGAAMTWTFSLSPLGVPDTVEFLLPSNTPYASNFPSSNLSVKQGPSYSFFDKSSASLLANGFNLDLDSFFSDAALSINPAITILEFPTNFGDDFQSNGTGSITFPLEDTIDLGGSPTYVDSIQVTYTVDQWDSVNGYGDLNIDTSSLQVLRVETLQRLSFSLMARIELFPNVFIWVPVPGQIVPPLELRSVNYYGKNKDYPVLTFQLDSTGDVIGNTYQSEPPIKLGLFQKDDLVENLILFPNPAEDRIFLKGKDYSGNTYRIFSVSGKLEALGIYEPVNGIVIGHLSEGNHFIQIESQKTTLARGRFSIKR